MTTYAHIRGGKVLDPREADGIDGYKALFSDGQVAEWTNDTFKTVTDGTKHGATDNGDGTFTNPPPPAQQPTTMSKNEFMTWFDATFGANATPTKSQINSAWPNV